MTQKPEFFWAPPNGEPILNIITFQDMIVIAVPSGVWVMCHKDKTLHDWVVRKVSEIGL